MKLDIRLLRNILNNIQIKESHYVLVSDLLEDVRADYDSLDKETFENLFYGHLYLLKDNKVIQELKGDNLGVSYGLNGHITKSCCFIRLTSAGYDYLKILNKNGIVDKLKNFTLTEGQKIAESLLIEGIKHFIN